ncbi:hypothetical protein QF049_002864 [Paenibacillus sp. W4I10]|uniref:hypothetical protein n=1 Tax=Paenibacillus sp. W4I10 TaxID=3042298 RepID=UPI00278B66D0|nr:hypothetical protein [Paenibacillus sp. W4I10]MDQ0721603.1 hypothetical protein [Paenibacillus sp. W4I10]
MAVPATTGQLREKLSDMEIGDYIVWKYDNTITGYIFGGSTTGYTEIPLTGNPLASMPLKYFWYAVKVDKGLLIADRVVSNTITWDWLNSNKFVEGSPRSISGISGVVRCPSGGVAYADASGNKVLTSTNTGYGAWPTINEWDTHVVNFPGNKILSGKSLNDVWNFMCMTWCKETTVPLSGTVPGGWTTGGRTVRSENITNSKDRFWSTASNYSNVAVGFRPVFEYKEV